MVPVSNMITQNIFSKVKENILRTKYLRFFIRRRNAYSLGYYIQEGKKTN